MSKAILDKSARVLVVETNSTARATLSEVLKENGFKDIQLMDSVKSALGYLEVEKAEWVISPVLADQPLNAMHLLSVFAKHSHFDNTRMSLLIESKDQSCLTKAFELGLLSFHQRPTSIESARAEIRNLLSELSKHNGDEVFVSADYLTTFLRNQNQSKSFLSLQGTLFDLYPDHLPFLLSLAEGHFMNGDPNSGKQALGRAKLMKIEGWEQVAQQFIDESEVIQPDLGVREAIILEPDDAVRKQICELLQCNSTAKLHTFEQAEEALAFCEKNPNIDLVLQEWKIPGLGGANFLQRLRKTTRATLPVLVVSSLVTKSDMVLLDEMGVANVIEKPVQEKDFLTTLVQTIQQEYAPTTFDALERKIHQNLKLGREDRAEKYWQKLQSNQVFPKCSQTYLNALFAFHENKFLRAKELLFEAIKQGAEPVKAFNLLGRTLAKLNDFSGACKCFQKAQQLSPKNVERLCEIASCQTELSQFSTAKQTIEKAKKLDGSSRLTAVSELKLALKSGDNKEAKRLLSETKAQSELVAEMNNLAVTYVLAGQFEKGKTLYTSTLEAIDAKEQELRGRVLYNLALAHARNKDLQTAKSLLDSFRWDASFEVSKKAKSLQIRLENAIRDDLPLIFVNSDNSAGTDAHEHIEIETLAGNAAKTNATRGNVRCCHKIFKAVEGTDPKWAVIANDAPKFNTRSAIERQDSLGIERLSKN